MTYQQYRAVRRLVHSCCNYDQGNCLLLDDGLFLGGQPLGLGPPCLGGDGLTGGFQCVQVAGGGIEQGMRSMREDIKAVETLKKTADRLAREGQTQRRAFPAVQSKQKCGAPLLRFCRANHNSRCSWRKPFRKVPAWTKYRLPARN